MSQNDLYKEFIEKLKKEKQGKELADYIAGLLKLGASELYLAMTVYLTDEDMQLINDEPSDEKAMELIKERFKLRTQMTPEEFVSGLRDEIAKNYLFPELTKTTSKTD